MNDLQTVQDDLSNATSALEDLRLALRDGSDVDLDSFNLMVAETCSAAVSLPKVDAVQVRQQLERLLEELTVGFAQFKTCKDIDLEELGYTLIVKICLGKFAAKANTRIGTNQVEASPDRIGICKQLRRSLRIRHVAVHGFGTVADDSRNGFSSRGVNVGAQHSCASGREGAGDGFAYTRCRACD